MAVYIIASIDITDPEDYQEYARQAGATVAQYGGRYLARGGQIETLEGDWQPGRIALLEFPTAEQAWTWYNSPEYSAIRGIRQRASHSRVILVHGLPEQPA
ncbi:DUF1330 domain-containing protein [Thermogemmatispora onikobensis]|uniref:DUF1330 domain-containing protein n=1 Tax=Thermogemmatispora onikobensis TaxID=732234 RepID=UPI0008532838|nr:DUF1330 domain-containing protein [Thermogemmatispora onikobensis]